MTDFHSKAQDAVFEEWEGMVRAAREDEGETAGIGPFRTALDAAHHEAVACRSLRRTLAAEVQETALRQRRAMSAGREAASRLRHFVKGVFGPRSAKLVRYGIRLRKLRRPPRGGGEGGGLVS